MDDPEFVKVRHTRCDFKQLGIGVEWERRGAPIELTSRKRFAFGLDFAYCIMSPLAIHSLRMRKLHGSVETETPSKGKMFGWDKCLHPMISLHNR